MRSFLLTAVAVTMVTLSLASDGYYDSSSGKGYKKPSYSQPQTYPVPMPYPVQQQTSSCGGCGCGCNGRRRRDVENEDLTEEESSLPPVGFVRMTYPDGKTVLVPIAVSPNSQPSEQDSSEENEAE